MSDACMKWLDTTGKRLTEDENKVGSIVDYAVTPRSPQDPDL
jgi:hypothetical protein